jgi:hypothetical protein
MMLYLLRMRRISGGLAAAHPDQETVASMERPERKIERLSSQINLLIIGVQMFSIQPDGQKYACERFGGYLTNLASIRCSTDFEKGTI